MNTNHPSAKRTYEYQPTIIESRLLIERLAIQLAFLKSELKRNWVDFKSDPATFVTRSRRDLVRYLKCLITAPNVVTACLTAVLTVVCFLELAMWIEKKVPTDQEAGETAELVMLSLPLTHDANRESGFGIDGPGRVGINRGKGEGSGAIPKPSGGGGGGGNRNPRPEQVGELPQPSIIPAAIPVAPPINPPALPVAGIDIDPALWKDLKAPVFGDPRSTSETPSKGPGEGEGIGSNRGTGVGEGDGAGFGRGNDRNSGGDGPSNGCCGPGSGGGPGAGRSGILRSPEVDQRARLIFKPEPQYTEEARRNQITGTVMLRVVFSNTGEVVQIRAVRTLPFGLTERAIVAARQIKFVPAMKDGQPVSVHMQLEYNFNLY